jgi:hypothetical protein
LSAPGAGVAWRHATEFADTLVWLIRRRSVTSPGDWLCLAPLFFHARPERTLRLEHFATFALLVLVLTTLGGVLHAG